MNTKNPESEFEKLGKALEKGLLFVGQDTSFNVPFLASPTEKAKYFCTGRKLKLHLSSLPVASASKMAGVLMLLFFPIRNDQLPYCCGQVSFTETGWKVKVYFNKQPLFKHEQAS